MTTETREIDVDLIQRGRYQPRTEMSREALEELAESIRAHNGVIQPIVVRPISDGRFEILAGERRWRATQIAGLHKIEAVVRECDDRGAVFISLTENVQREDLNPLDEAVAIKRIIDEFGGTHDEISKTVGYKSRSVVTNKLRLLKLGRVAKDLLIQGLLTEAQARPLVGLEEIDQTILAREAVARRYDSKTIERRAMKLKGRPDTGPGAKKDPEWVKLEREISDKLGNNAVITAEKSGEYKLAIDAHSLEELEGIVEHILRRKLD